MLESLVGVRDTLNIDCNQLKKANKNKDPAILVRNNKWTDAQINKRKNGNLSKENIFLKLIYEGFKGKISKLSYTKDIIADET